MYKILIDYREHNKWLLSEAKKHPQILKEILFFKDVAFPITMDGKQMTQYMAGGAASEIASSYSDSVYDDYPDVQVYPDVLREVIVVTNIQTKRDAIKIKKEFNCGNGGETSYGKRIPKNKITIVRVSNS